jgi:hypothetical protein
VVATADSMSPCDIPSICTMIYYSVLDLFVFFCPTLSSGLQVVFLATRGREYVVLLRKW